MYIYIYILTYIHVRISIAEAHPNRNHDLARWSGGENEAEKPKPAVSLDRDVVLPALAQRTGVPPSVLSAVAVAVARKKQKPNWDVELHWFVCKHSHWCQWEYLRRCNATDCLQACHLCLLAADCCLATVTPKHE